MNARNNYRQLMEKNQFKWAPIGFTHECCWALWLSELSAISVPANRYIMCSIGLLSDMSLWAQHKWDCRTLNFGDRWYAQGSDQYRWSRASTVDNLLRFWLELSMVETVCCAHSRLSDFFKYLLGICHLYVFFLFSPWSFSQWPCTTGMSSALEECKWESSILKRIRQWNHRRGTSPCLEPHPIITFVLLNATCQVSRSLDTA